MDADGPSDAVAGADTGAAGGFSVSVRFAGSALDVALPSGATLAQLQEALERRCGVIARKQKLMAKGSVLTGGGNASTTPLAALGVGAGAKLMLLAAAGTATAGQAALRSARAARADAAAARPARAPAAPPPPAGGALARRAAVWARTGIAPLRALGLAAAPPELFAPAIAAALRVLDLGNNALAELPPAVSALTALAKLRLSFNALGDDGVPWAALAALPRLEVLALDGNLLTALPPALGRLVRLRALDAGGNAIAALPAEVGALTALRALRLASNRLAALPPQLAACEALEEADLSHNALAALPPELGALPRLAVLLLDHNRLAAAGLPRELLAGAAPLALLSLHGNPATVEALREAPGWPEYDARRRARADKTVGMKVLPRGGGFDEGADFAEWERWKSAEAP
jgi:hypothetical protein